ncbi:MAG: DUF3261 domain-containing protein [Acinetobacter sp.]
MKKMSACGLTVMLLLTLMLSACQSWYPKAVGLQSAQWQAQSYHRQDQLEIQWKNKSFSFLLYQQQQGQSLTMLALSLTGQPLFQLSFDGKHVQVQQRIDALKLLPFEFLVRDILFATYPNFSTLHSADVQQRQQGDINIIQIHQQDVLQIRRHHTVIDVENRQVPYRMFFSPVRDLQE